MYVPRAFVHQAEFQGAVARAARKLGRDVVNVIPTLGDDWTGEPAVFFMVILVDSATRRDLLLNNVNKVSQTLIEQVQPLEEWGVYPYFNFRSESEHAQLSQPSVA
ncbi:MAG TPA: hypothetical protein VMH80_28550 [Bryobacteraceae bacterium]|nr:hypothetical protein [Bryobacteraceae bacterium]